MSEWHRCPDQTHEDSFVLVLSNNATTSPPNALEWLERQSFSIRHVCGKTMLSISYVALPAMVGLVRLPRRGQCW
jgi:hypothetical protein